MFSTDAIDKPRLWRLILMVDGTDALRAVVTSTVEDSSLLQFSLPLDPSVPRIKALEEAVYAAPVLLSDFGRVDIVVRTDAYTIAPSELDEAACAACASITALTAVASESDRSPVIMTDAPGTATAKAIWTLEPDTSSFLARTFRNPSVVCHVTPLLRYFSRKTLLGNTAKLYAHFNSGSARSVDILVFGPDGSPSMISSHPATSGTDAVYYILASAKACGLAFDSDEILICGDAAMRDAVMPTLRRYFNYVMPVIFPSAAFRAGREALKAPFPLIILPLCE